MKRHRNKWDYCTCEPGTSIKDSTQTICKNGRCLEWRCPWCNGWLGGAGPVGCGCEGYYIRQQIYPGMRPLISSVAIKPSIARRRRQRRQREEYY